MTFSCDVFLRRCHLESGLNVQQRSLLPVTSSRADPNDFEFMCDPRQLHPITPVHLSWSMISAHRDRGGRKAAEVRENKERERQTRHQNQNQLQLQTTRDQLHCRELRVWTLAANYSLSLVETKFMAPSWSCSWHHKLNWQTVLESEPTASSPEKRSRPKHCQHGCVKTPGFIMFNNVNSQIWNYKCVNCNLNRII